MPARTGFASMYRSTTRRWPSSWIAGLLNRPRQTCPEERCRLWYRQVWATVTDWRIRLIDSPGPGLSRRWKWLLIRQWPNSANGYRALATRRDSMNRPHKSLPYREPLHFLVAKSGGRDNN